MNRKGEEGVHRVVWEQGLFGRGLWLVFHAYQWSASTSLHGGADCSAAESNSIGQHSLWRHLLNFARARLIVDRSIKFENLKKVSAWIDVDGAYDRGPGPKVSQGLRKFATSYRHA